MLSQDTRQEKAIGSRDSFKQSSAGGLGRCEAQVSRLPETWGADKLKLSFPLTPRKKKKQTHYVFCISCYQFQAWDWRLFVQLLRHESGSSGLGDLPLTVPSSGVVGKRKEREDEQLVPSPDSSQLFSSPGFLN